MRDLVFRGQYMEKRYKCQMTPRVIRPILAYPRMYDAHLLLSNSILAEGDYLAARTLVERTIPYVSHRSEDRAALLSVVLRSWIADK